METITFLVGAAAIAVLCIAFILAFTAKHEKTFETSLELTMTGGLFALAYMFLCGHFYGYFL